MGFTKGLYIYIYLNLNSTNEGTENHDLYVYIYSFCMYIPFCKYIHVYIYILMFTWNLFVLYFGASTLQKKAFSNQNKGHLGSRYSKTCMINIYIYMTSFEDQ